MGPDRLFPSAIGRMLARLAALGLTTLTTETRSPSVLAGLAEL